MDPEATSPAAVAEVPQDSGATVPAGTTPAPETPAAAAPQATEPDYESLFAQDDVVERLLKHPKAQERLRTVRQADIERRADEIAAQKAEALLRQRDAAYAEQRQRERARDQRVTEIHEELRLIEEDPTHPLAQRRKAQLEAEQRQITDADIRQRLRGEIEPEVHKRVWTDVQGQWLGWLHDAIASDEGLTDDEKRSLDPRDPKWRSLGEFLKTWTKTSASKEAAKLAKDLAKVEAQALLTAQQADKRNGEHTPAALPSGAGAMADGEFLAAYGRGERTSGTDHKRAMDILKSL